MDRVSSISGNSTADVEIRKENGRVRNIKLYDRTRQDKGEKVYLDSGRGRNISVQETKGEGQNLRKEDSADRANKHGRFTLSVARDQNGTKKVVKERRRRNREIQPGPWNREKNWGDNLVDATK